MLRNAPVFNRPNSFPRSPVALLLVFPVSTMSAAACFAGQKRLKRRRGSSKIHYT
jgi:hypothetical protein